MKKKTILKTALLLTAAVVYFWVVPQSLEISQYRYLDGLRESGDWGDLERKGTAVGLDSRTATTC